jgi:hypothetical protein
MDPTPCADFPAPTSLAPMVPKHPTGKTFHRILLTPMLNAVASQGERESPRKEYSVARLIVTSAPHATSEPNDHSGPEWFTCGAGRLHVDA